MTKPTIAVTVPGSLRELLFSRESLDRLASFAEVRFNETGKNLTPEELARFLRDADGAITS